MLRVGLMSAAAVLASDQAVDLDRAANLIRGAKFADAERELQSAVEAEPGNARAHQLLGVARLQLGKTKEAEAELTEAAKLSPESADVKVAMARLHIEQKQFEKAQKALDEAKEIDSGVADLALYRGALQLARKNYKVAAEELESAIERDAENAYAHYYAGLAYSGLKKPDKMVNHFQSFLRLAPDAPEAGRVQSLLRSVR